MSKNHGKHHEEKSCKDEKLKEPIPAPDEKPGCSEPSSNDNGKKTNSAEHDEKFCENKSEEKTETILPKTTALEEAQSKIAELESNCKDWQEQYLRKAADFENYRKRMIREKQEAIDYANSNLLSDLIQVLDDFDRAIDAGKTSLNENKTDKTEQAGNPGNAFAEGVIMIKNQMNSMLSSKYGLMYYPAKGEPFDPNIHEAISMIQSPDVKEPVVGEEIQKGYKLKDRIIRSSKVMVLMPAEKKKKKTENEIADKKN